MTSILLMKLYTLKLIKIKCLNFVLSLKLLKCNKRHIKYTHFFKLTSKCIIIMCSQYLPSNTLL